MIVFSRPDQLYPLDIVGSSSHVHILHCCSVAPVLKSSVSSVIEREKESGGEMAQSTIRLANIAEREM